MPSTYWEWPEDSDELRDVAHRMVLLGMSNVVQWVIPANPWVLEGTWCHLRAPAGLGVNHDVYITSAVTDGPQQGPILTRLTGLLVPDTLDLL